MGYPHGASHGDCWKNLWVLRQYWFSHNQNCLLRLDQRAIVNTRVTVWIVRSLHGVGEQLPSLSLCFPGATPLIMGYPCVISCFLYIVHISWFRTNILSFRGTETSSRAPGNCHDRATTRPRFGSILWPRTAILCVGFVSYALEIVFELRTQIPCWVKQLRVKS